ncbi:MAG: hypothetical protein AABX10_03895 [Nanoarchaeota archaeon]
MDNCKTCNSIIQEITIFNGETKNFCSFECVNTYDLIDSFTNYVQNLIDKYQYIRKDELRELLRPMKKKIIDGLIFEVVSRKHFISKEGILYPLNKKVIFPRK